MVRSALAERAQLPSVTSRACRAATPSAAEGSESAGGASADERAARASDGSGGSSGTNVQPIRRPVAAQPAASAGASEVAPTRQS